MNNTVTLVGNLTRDPELRFTTGGTAVASCGLAWNKRFQRGGEWQEEVSFFNLTIWGDMAENAASSLVKGTRVIVFGELQQRSYENREGATVNAVEVKVDSIGPDLRWATVQVDRVEREDQTTRAAAVADNLPEEEPF